MTELTDKLYPTLPTIREDPTAPPVVNGGEKIGAMVTD